MVISKAVAERIKKAVEKNYARLLVGVLGGKALSPQEREELRRLGVPVSSDSSLVEALYHHNYLNPSGTPGPGSVEEMQAQQEGRPLPSSDLHTASKEFLQGTLKQAIADQRADMLSRVEALIRETNHNFKFGIQADAAPTDEESMKQFMARMRDLSGDANRNWTRVVSTEVSNAVSLGSVDRIVDENADKNPNEVYVYRIVVQDAALCKYCRRFYLDSDGSPKVYRLSTLLSNGSNAGRKRANWLPSATATHPNERCSQVIELKPGFRVLPGGAVTFIGIEAWAAYIASKVEN